MRCPICLKKVKKPTKEHLPFKALYKNLSEIQDNAAVIKICKECNHEKSLWDQEFLAVYGHILDISRAKLSQRSLKQVSSVNDAFHICLLASRGAHTHGDAIVKHYNLPCDLITQWFWMCGRGIYYFFEKKPFEGNRVFIYPSLIDHNTNASEFSFDSKSSSGHECKYHKINESCYVWIMRNGKQSPMIAMSMVNQKTNRIFSIQGFFSEDDSQIEYDKKHINTLNIDPRPIRTAKARDIFDVPKKEDGWTYKGVKKVD